MGGPIQRNWYSVRSNSLHHREFTAPSCPTDGCVSKAIRAGVPSRQQGSLTQIPGRRMVFSDGVGDHVPMSTTVEVVLVTALVLGIVAAIFVLIYAWEKWAKGTRLEQRVDRFFDRISDMF